MVSLFDLWLPILLSGVFVFIVSSVLHMALKYHKSDFKKVPKEDAVMEALNSFDIPPGDYYFPYAENQKAMSSDEYKAKMEKGPVWFFTVLPKGQTNMLKNLSSWFLYSLIVSVFAGYLASRALDSGAYYLDVFRFTGTTAFVGYSLALMHNSIWYSRSWSSTLKSMFDGLIYALFTAGTFGWLWP